MIPDRPRWSLRITRSAGEAEANVFVRKHHFAVGAPLSFDEEYKKVTALEYALGALGADLINGVAELARKKRVELDQLEAVVQGELENALAHLGVIGAEGSPRLAWVGMKVYVSSLDDEDVIRGLWEQAVQSSPLARTLQGAVGLELTLKAT